LACVRTKPRSLLFVQRLDQPRDNFPHSVSEKRERQIFEMAFSVGRRAVMSATRRNRLGLRFSSTEAPGQKPVSPHVSFPDPINVPVQLYSFISSKHKANALVPPRSGSTRPSHGPLPKFCSWLPSRTNWHTGDGSSWRKMRSREVELVSGVH